MTIPPKSTGNGSRSRAACLRWTPRHEQLETERQSQANHADRSAKTHHTGSAGTALGPASTPHRVQAGYADIQYTASPHLSDECQLVLDADRRLRSSAALSTVVPRTRTRMCDWSFDVAGPRADLEQVATFVRLTEDFGCFK